MVVRAVEISVRNDPSGTRRMNKAATSCINSDVIDVAAANSEKDEITRR